MNKTDQSCLIRIQNWSSIRDPMKKFFAALLSTPFLASIALVGPAQAGRASAAPPSPSGWVYREDVRNGGLFQMASQIVPLSQVLEMINSIEPGNQLDTAIVTEMGDLFTSCAGKLPAATRRNQRNGHPPAGETSASHSRAGN
jgi:hypothetical protein